MTKINDGNDTFDILPDESVLDALIRLNKSPSFQCQKGVCQSCVLQLINGKVPARANENLLLKYQQKGYFLACLCYPTEDITVRIKSK